MLQEIVYQQCAACGDVSLLGERRSCAFAALPGARFHAPHRPQAALQPPCAAYQGDELLGGIGCRLEAQVGLQLPPGAPRRPLLPHTRHAWRPLVPCARSRAGASLARAARRAAAALAPGARPLRPSRRRAALCGGARPSCPAPLQAGGAAKLYIMTLAVLAPYRGQGIGARLGSRAGLAPSWGPGQLGGASRSPRPCLRIPGCWATAPAP
jgi:GNAT superfamily N-acetyltransferase